MAEPGVRQRVTLRFWPWLAMSASGAVLFGLLAWYAGWIAASTPNTTPFVIATIVLAGLVALTIYSLASLRTRSVLDTAGWTARTAFSRTTVPWAEVEQLRVTHSLPGWAVQAWLADGRSVVVYMCHDTHGKKQRAESFDHPPEGAPRAIKDGYRVIESFWRSAAASAK